MRHYNLGFISDEEIYEHVKNTVLQYRRSISLEEFNANIVDPIKLTFDAKVYGKTMEEVVADECFRQIDKSNTNKIGYFHQQLFNYAGMGWIVPETGFDVENHDFHIFVEMKNKHNTMNSASSQKTYMKMQNKLLEDDLAQCYLVEAISTPSKDEPWIVSIDGRQFQHNKIRRMSMDRFYGVVFNDSRGFFKLCEALPTIIEDVVADNSEMVLNNSVFADLKKNNQDVLKSLYLLAFSTYEGFDVFKQK